MPINIKDKVRYYDIQASVKSKKKKQEKEKNIIPTSKNSGICLECQT